MERRVEDVALIFEGGGMRNSYSSGVVNVLLENGIHFTNVYGLSAGATNAVNYLSRDLWRSEVSFTDYIDDLSFRRPVAFLLNTQRGAGSEAHIRYARSGKDIPFDFDTFRANPAHLTLQAVERDTGRTRYFTREDFTSTEKLMACVRASTSYPIIMPPKKLDGTFYYDGGIGDGGGIMLPRAQRDGLQRFFVVRTRPKGYRKPEQGNPIYPVFFWRRPWMKKLLATWGRRYNAELDKLDKLEEAGLAYVFYAEDQGVENSERNIDKLKENCQRGYRQAHAELPLWRSFLQ